MQKLEDNYSSSLKSMSKTISPFLIILTMTHNGICELCSVFVCHTGWDLNTCDGDLFSNQHMVRIRYIWKYKPVRCRVPMLVDHGCSSTLGSSLFLSSSFSCWNLPKSHKGVCCPVFSTIQHNMANPTKASHN